VNYDYITIIIIIIIIYLFQYKVRRGRREINTEFDRETRRDHCEDRCRW